MIVQIALHRGRRVVLSSAAMTKPKLIYFNAPVSHGEECRLALRLAGIDFEDVRIEPPLAEGLPAATTGCSIMRNLFQKSSHLTDSGHSWIPRSHQGSKFLSRIVSWISEFA